jgi:hypothetical protein
MRRRPLLATDQEAALLRVPRILQVIGIPYLLTGSVAASIYAEPRMTRDVDILIDPRAEDRELLVQALSDDDFAVFPDSVNEASVRRSMFNVIDQRSLTKVDMIVREGNATPTLSSSAQSLHTSPARTFAPSPGRI